jgi:pimeloyl-ACP methyl ester carboxylesterase
MTKFEAGIEGIVFPCQGERLLGVLYRGGGDGPRPTLILLHGVPGLEKSTDIAYALREVGWNVFMPHFRGCWGSGGNFSLNGLTADVAAAAEVMWAHPAVDGDRLCLAGVSGGGWATIAAGAAEPRYRALISICPMVDPRLRLRTLEDVADYARMLNGITPGELIQQLAALTPLQILAPALAGRRALLVSGSQDEFFPPDHMRLLAEAQPEIEWLTIDGADHGFTHHRRALVTTVVTWLQRAVGE